VGLLYTNEGDVVPLQSGDKELDRYPASGHVEAKAALEIRRRGSTGGTVYHNHPEGTCLRCFTQVPTFLPEGAQLLIVPPQNAVAENVYWFDQPIVRIGNENNPKGM